MDNERLNILKLLIENQNKVFSIRQISIQRKINYKSAYNALKALDEEGVVSLNKQGNMTVCSFNHKFNDSVFQVEYDRLSELLKDKNFLILYDHLVKIKEQFILLLFGSYAKGKQSRGSDIDLLLITDDKKEVESRINLLPLSIHLSQLSYSEFDSMLKSKEFTVVSEAARHNIILFGIEDYYRLMNNAG